MIDFTDEIEEIKKLVIKYMINSDERELFDKNCNKILEKIYNHGIKYGEGGIRIEEDSPLNLKEEVKVISSPYVPTNQAWIVENTSKWKDINKSETPHILDFKEIGKDIPDLHSYLHSNFNDDRDFEVVYEEELFDEKYYVCRSKNTDEHLLIRCTENWIIRQYTCLYDSIVRSDWREAELLKKKNKLREEVEELEEKLRKSHEKEDIFAAEITRLSGRINTLIASTPEQHLKELRGGVKKLSPEFLAEQKEQHQKNNAYTLFNSSFQCSDTWADNEDRIKVNNILEELKLPNLRDVILGIDKNDSRVYKDYIDRMIGDMKQLYPHLEVAITTDRMLNRKDWNTICIHLEPHLIFKLAITINEIACGKE